MQGRHWTVTIWVASLAAAWLAGQHLAGPSSSGTTDFALAEENGRLRDRVAALERAREEAGPALEARGTPGALDGSPAAPAPAARAGAPSSAAGAAASFEPVEQIDLAAIQTPEELSKAFLAYARTLLAKGREGHLELLRWIGGLADKGNEGHFDRIFARGGEQALAGAIYPVIKYAVNHEKQVMALTETFFEQAAENPAWFAEMDDNPFELFTEGIGMVAPAVSDEQQLARLRGYAMAILEQDQASQPKALSGNRRDIERLLRAWSPPMAPEEVLAKLEAGTLSDAEIMSLLPALPPAALARVDIDRYVGPRVEAGDWGGLQLLRRLPSLDEVTRSRLDQRVLRGAGSEPRRVQPWFVAQYVQSTGRRTWDDARAFFETGLGMEGRTADVFAEGLLHLGSGRPHKRWVRWALGRFRLSPSVADHLKRRFGLTD